MVENKYKQGDIFECPIYSSTDVVRCTDLDGNTSFEYLLKHLKIKHKQSDLAYFIARHIQDQILR
jgi:hypothetical protein